MVLSFCYLADIDDFTFNIQIYDHIYSWCANSPEPSLIA